MSDPTGAGAVSTAENFRTRFLGANSLLLLFAVGVVPNIFFFSVSLFFLAERMISPLLYVLAALAMIFVAPIAGWIAFVVVAVIDLGLIISFAFHLPPNIALDSLRYVASIDIRASFLYLSILGIVIATTGLSAYLTHKHRGRLRSASPTPVVLLALALLAYDWNYTFPYLKVAAGEFESARAKSGLTDVEIKSNGKNLLIVMVEGLGAFADPGDRRIFETALRRDLPTGRFDYRTGTTAYQGSTTAAAARELCGEWADYMAYVEGAEHDCMPRRLARAGYRTIAYHGFPAQLFQRDRWYPQIGFTELYFPERLLREHGDLLDRRCGSVFHGLCDEQLGEIVHSNLLAQSDRPQMIYWLTLNSHVPFVPRKDGQLSCGEPKPRIDERTVCELSEIWLRIFDKVNEIAGDPDLPPTDILVVGDHHTPLWRRSAKNRFTLGRVDWFLLTDRREGHHRYTLANVGQNKD